MTTTKNLGIWMDHSTAHITELKKIPMSTQVVASKFTREQKEQSLNRSEHIMHNKEQHQQSEYYKQLGDVIRNYEAVILFGPTDAKAELFNILKADHRFENIRIDMKPADKMTEYEQHIFVRDHFAGS